MYILCTYVVGILNVYIQYALNMNEYLFVGFRQMSNAAGNGKWTHGISWEESCDM